MIVAMIPMLANRIRTQLRLCALLDICSRTIVAQFSAISVYRRLLKRAPENPQTLGEHLRLVRIDRGLKQRNSLNCLV
jgi:hypothetical protein